MAQGKAMEAGGGPPLESKWGKEDTQAGDMVAAQCVVSEPSTVSSAGRSRQPGVRCESRNRGRKESV